MLFDFSIIVFSPGRAMRGERRQQRGLILVRRRGAIAAPPPHRRSPTRGGTQIARGGDNLPPALVPAKT